MDLKTEENTWTKNGEIEVTAGRGILCKDRLHNFNIYFLPYIIMIIK
jgi:hypothetical protein